MTDLPSPAVSETQSTETAQAKTPRRGGARRGLVVGALALPLALGAAGLSFAQKGEVATTPLEPVAISALAPSGAVAAKGEVAEIFGNKFILQDATGRTLVETGRQGEGGELVRKGETVTVRGRFEKGFFHAASLVRADGTVTSLKPQGGPPPGGIDWMKDKVGLGPEIDLPGLKAKVEAAGYTDVRIAGRGPKHLDVAAKGSDGRERMLHVGFNGDIREKRVF
ncbi:DNA-binding protein [Methylorubrum sp. SB2]|uniref:DNA-binding protein n=1 Tax=Methylorubrum subtropicum TaxID=3138812 RepID=UPI00313BBA4A